MIACLVFFFAAPALAQHAGKNPEFHPRMPVQKCTSVGSCTTEETSLVIDSNWRWTHDVGSTDPKNCYTNNTWSKSLCPDVDTCTKNCAIDGVDEKTWKNTYGVSVPTDGEVDLSFVTQGPNSRNVGSRTYLMENDTHYKMFNLLNKEFTFEVDVSDMPCGLNGALYFVEMPADGGLAKYDTNEAGAKYGTGYCDAQCPHDLKWINGQANIKDWTPSKTDINAGTGHYGTCCAELDLWEANQISTQMTVHSCSIEGQYRCGDDPDKKCGDGDDRFKGVCDKDGCDFNPYRVGSKSFYGPSSDFTIDTTKKITVTTQFITTDDTDKGDLKEVRRVYMQDGKQIQNPTASLYDGDYSTIKDTMCNEQKKVFDDVNDFQKKGGMKTMGDAMRRGMTLVLSMWDDHADDMKWLDATKPYPAAGRVGALRGTCTQDSGNPDTVEKKYPRAHVKYSNIRYGAINSTAPPTPPTPPTPTPTPSANKCCWGGDTCDVVADCHYDVYCDASEDNCQGNCHGVWCHNTLNQTVVV